MPEPTSVARASREAPDDEPTDEEREIHREALERFQECLIAENDWRTKAREELNFLNGEHWTSAMRDERQGLPCLTFDRIGPSVDQVTNDTRQSPMQPSVSPVGGGADKYTAEVIEGLIRNIDNDSDGTAVVLMAYEHAVQIGRGWVGVLKDWETDDADSQEAFLQKLVIRGFPNPFSVYPDPAADKLDYSDMRFCFVTEDLSKGAYEELYGDVNIPASASLEGPGDKQRDSWYPNGNVRVAEYWKVEIDEIKVALLQGGRVVPIDDPSITRDGARPIATRRVLKRKVKGYKINGERVIDTWDWDGSTIPLIPILGKQFISEDKRKFRGMVRPAMDGNLMFDYISSKIAEAAALAPKSQWLAAEGQLEGYEGFFADSNRKPIAVLPYKVIDASGRPVPPPQRISPNIDISGLVGALSIFDNNTKAALSIYDASLGAPGPEQSGRAIIARQREGDNAHFNYRDSLSRSMRRMVKIFLETFPHVYNDQRLLTINDPDGSTRTVPINQKHLVDGTERIYALGKKYGVGRYDVVVGSAPTYATRLQEGWQSFVQLSQAIPTVMATCADIGIRNSGIPGADEMADRIKSKMGLPPDESDMSPAAQQALSALQQQIQLLQAELQKAQSDVEKHRLDNASRERITAMQEETKRALALLKSGSEEAIAQLQEDMAFLRSRFEQLASSPETANPEVPPQGNPGQTPPAGGSQSAPPAAIPPSVAPTPAPAAA